MNKCRLILHWRHEWNSDTHTRAHQCKCVGDCSTQKIEIAFVASVFCNVAADTGYFLSLIFTLMRRWCRKRAPSGTRWNRRPPCHIHQDSVDLVELIIHTWAISRARGASGENLPPAAPKMSFQVCGTDAGGTAAMWRGGNCRSLRGLVAWRDDSNIYQRLHFCSLVPAQCFIP